MCMQLITDKELVRQYLDGKESAFEILMNRHKNRVITSIYIMVRDEQLAEDIFQDTFIKVIMTLRKGKYNEEGKFLPWTLRIAHNLTIDHFRKAKRMPVVRESSGPEDFNIFSTISSEEINVEEEEIKTQIHRDVKDLVNLLPDEQREIIKLRLYFDCSFKEIADLTNVSINTALGRMRYALINLRKIAEEKKVMLTI